jgi:hypothetical protein
MKQEDGLAQDFVANSWRFWDQALPTSARMVGMGKTNMNTLGTGLDGIDECIHEAGSTSTLHSSQPMVMISAAAKSRL